MQEEVPSAGANDHENIIEAETAKLPVVPQKKQQSKKESLAVPSAVLPDKARVYSFSRAF